MKGIRTCCDEVKAGNKKKISKINTQKQEIFLLMRLLGISTKSTKIVKDIIVSNWVTEVNK